MPLRPDRVRRGGRRVLTSAAPAVTEGDGDRCRCGRNCSAAVWRGQRASGASPAAGNANERHGARAALTPPPRRVGDAIDGVASKLCRSRWPPIPSHRAGRDLALRRDSGPFGRPECESCKDRPFSEADRAHRGSPIRRSRGSSGVAENREEDDCPTGVIGPSGRGRRRPAETAPRVPNRPSQRARIRFLAEVGCRWSSPTIAPPAPLVVDVDSRPRRRPGRVLRQRPCFTVATTGTPNSRPAGRATTAAVPSTLVSSFLPGPSR